MGRESGSERCYLFQGWRAVRMAWKIQKISCKNWFIPLTWIQIRSYWATGRPSSPCSLGRTVTPSGPWLPQWWRESNLGKASLFSSLIVYESKVKNLSNRHLGWLYPTVFYSWGWVKWHEYETYNFKKIKLILTVSLFSLASWRWLLFCVILNEARDYCGWQNLLQFLLSASTFSSFKAHIFMQTSLLSAQCSHNPLTITGLITMYWIRL